MNWLRYALIAGICAVSYLLFLNWNEFEEAKAASERQNQETLLSSDLPTAPLSENSPTSVPDLNEQSQANDIPKLPSNVNPVIEPVNIQANPTLISVKTDRFDILIDTFGGDLVRVALQEHLDKLEENGQPFVLMNRSNAKTYIAQSGLIGTNGTDKSGNQRPVFSTSNSSFEMKDGQDNLVVDLTLQDSGVSITKRFTFQRDSYLINVDYIVSNNSNALWRAAPYGQIRRSDYEVENAVAFGMQSYLGAATTTKETNYEEVTYGDIEDGYDSFSIKGGWVSMVQHYFISAWVPDQEVENRYSFRKQNSSGLYVMEYVGPVTSIEPGVTDSISSAFYAGPKDIKTLEKISPYLDLTIDFAWLSFIAKPMFFVLVYIHSFVGNWGVAIILLTLLIKIIFFYPSAMSYRSMAKMRKLQPLMAELKERYGDDRQKMSSELMKTYKKEKVNPLGGCLPILLQMPVFIALYWVLMESVELRHAPFALWITDLSAKDPYFILPLIMGATMFIQQKLNPTPPDPMQAKIMQMMPIFFTVLFLMFPAGLVLYWVVNNTLSITQQWIITRKIEKGEDA